MKYLVLLSKPLEKLEQCIVWNICQVNKLYVMFLLKRLKSTRPLLFIYNNWQTKRNH